MQCASSNEHRRHGFIDLLECVEHKREASQTDLQELESSILIEHNKFASCIRNQKVNLDQLSINAAKNYINRYPMLLRSSNQTLSRNTKKRLQP